MKLSEKDANLILKDTFPIAYLFLQKFPNTTNNEIYKLSGLGNNSIIKNTYLKRLKLVRSILQLSFLKEQKTEKDTLTRKDEEQIIALYLLLKNTIMIADILNIPHELVKICIERELDNYSIKYCDKCNLNYLSRKISIETKTVKEYFETPCPHCFKMTTKYPNETEPIDISDYKYMILDKNTLETALDYFVKFKMTINVYKRAKEKGTFSKSKAPTMQYLYDGILWLFGKTNKNFPHTFTSVCSVIKESPDKMRDDILKLLFVAEQEIKSSLIKQKIENLKVAENIIDFIEIASYYAFIGAETDEFKEYFKERYIQCSIPFLYNFTLT